MSAWLHWDSPPGPLLALACQGSLHQSTVPQAVLLGRDPVFQVPSVHRAKVPNVSK